MRDLIERNLMRGHLYSDNTKIPKSFASDLQYLDYYANFWAPLYVNNKDKVKWHIQGQFRLHLLISNIGKSESKFGKCENDLTLLLPNLLSLFPNSLSLFPILEIIRCRVVTDISDIGLLHGFRGQKCKYSEGAFILVPESLLFYTNVDVWKMAKKRQN